jgi:hypothetical protein
MARTALRCAALLCFLVCAGGFGDNPAAPEDAAASVGTAVAGDVTLPVAVSAAAAGDVLPLAPDDASTAAFSWKATLAEFAEQLKKGGAPLATAACDMHYYGSGWGGHTLCRPSTHALNKSCFYIKCAALCNLACACACSDAPCIGVLSCAPGSFGISNDFSFDTEVVKELGCSGIALDPTVSQPAEMVPGVFFLKLGATMHDTPVSWQSIELPRLWRWLGRRNIFALKYDCEGKASPHTRVYAFAAVVAGWQLCF